MSTLIRTVAHVTAADSFEFCPSFESAAQYKTLRVPAGVYPIEEHRSGGRTFFVLMLSGEVTASGYGAKKYPEEIGKTEESYRLLYDYQVTNAINEERICLAFGVYGTVKEAS